MSARLQIYFIRHGETTWSLSGQHTGRTDLPLTPHGESMAAALAPWLAQIAFSEVLRSPRLRAKQTCALAGLGPIARIEPKLAEWDYGDYEGLRSAEIRAAHPDWNIWTGGCPGGEMPGDVGERADRLIDVLRALSGNVALFSHGQFGKALAARWIGMPVDAGQHLALDPASVSILGLDADRPAHRVICLWNAAAGGAPGMR